MKKVIKFWKAFLPVQKIFSVVAVAALVIAPGVPAQVALADHDPFSGTPQTNVTVCHFNQGGGGSYNANTVSISSSGAPQGGHEGHANDIIPPYHWTDGDQIVQSYPGHNWDSNTEDIWNNGGCDGDGTLPDPEVGTVTILKQTDDDSGNLIEFDFTGDLGAFSVLGDGADSEVFADTEAGEYTITESTEGGWSLDSVTCDSGSWNEVEGGVTINLADEDNITCTFSNTLDEVDPETGTIVIEKAINGTTTGQSFDFTSDTSLGGFSLLGGESTSTVEELGDYSVSETVPANWNLDSAICVYDDQSTSTPSNIVLDTDGETVTCTFTNSFDEQGPTTGTIIVQKAVTEGSDTQQAFDFDASWDDGDVDFSLSDGQSTSTEQDPGTYSVSEVNIPGDWSLDSAVCQSTDEFDESTPGDINLSAGETITCTFTNDEEQDGGGGGPTPEQFTLTVTTSGEGGGTVAGAGISCTREGEATSGDCDESYDEDTVVTITATPDDDSNFDNSWSGACTGNNPVCQITMTGDMEVDAHFGLDTISGGGVAGGGGGGGGGGGQVAGASTGPTTPQPQVLGDQIAQIPLGAPATGAGGAADGGLLGTMLTLLGLIGFVGFRRAAVRA